MKKIRLEGKCNLPSLDQVGGKDVWQLNYGANRGWQTYLNESAAIAALNDHLDMRIHSAARDLADLCKLQRKYRNG
jgi:hypothetical protein